MAKKHGHRIKVQWGDTDAAGIVYYPNFYRWMDQAAHEWLASIGYPPARLYADERIAHPILEASCRFRSPAFFGDELIVETSAAEVRHKVFTVEHCFRRGEEVLAEGVEVRAWTSFANGRPKAVPIPDEVRRAMEEG